MYRTKPMKMATSYFRSSFSRALEGTISKDGKRSLDNAAVASMASQLAQTTSKERTTASSTVEVANQASFNVIIDRVHGLVFSR
eukprot:CAMPEP_0170206810 /NCGR_PEP_ID=MMETSP0116_2-20130129/2973_1 /TAXON_ID=400756 /ORGANISM="Durinskia baltica, Strain CSIRO CS-38" /LENGTH=83 /DNA_ID=CAMNT_0010457249 /DNA_START=65 /DNA_END=316 /DNA_ORIENTATION=+